MRMMRVSTPWVRWYAMVLASPRDEAVDSDHLVPLGEQSLGQVAAHEPGRPAEQYAHRPAPALVSRRWSAAAPRWPRPRASVGTSPRRHGETPSPGQRLP